MGRMYESYQQGALPWVQSIPSHWKWLRNGAFLNNHLEKVGNKFSEYQLLSLTTTGVKEKNINEVNGKVPESYEGYQKVFQGDMVFCLFDLDCSAVFSGLSDYDGMITSAYDVVRPKGEIVNQRFLKYWYDYVFTGRYYKIFSKSVRYTINYDSFKTIKTPVPPKPEQDQIVRYLDWKTSEIDRFIHQKKKQIKRLEELKKRKIDDIVTTGLDYSAKRKKTKASWMGEVPDKWTECRLKNLFREINVRSEKGLEPHLSMSQKKGLVTDDEEIERRLLSESYAGAKICEKDDLVLNRLKAHLGVFALAPMLGVVSPDYTVLRLDKRRIVPKYLEYLLKSNACRGELVIRVRGIVEGFWRLYTEDLGAIPVCIPDLEEQYKILNEIIKIDENINGLIDAVKAEISLLQELRTKIIADVVTGQIDVRDEIIPEYDNTEENEPDDELENEACSEEESDEEA